MCCQSKFPGFVGGGGKMNLVLWFIDAAHHCVCVYAKVGMRRSGQILSRAVYRLRIVRGVLSSTA